jgi:hypothetical protein
LYEAFRGPRDHAFVSTIENVGATPHCYVGSSTLSLLSALCWWSYVCHDVRYEVPMCQVVSRTYGSHHLVVDQWRAKTLQGGDVNLPLRLHQLFHVELCTRVQGIMPVPLVRLDLRRQSPSRQ